MKKPSLIATLFIAGSPVLAQLPATPMYRHYDKSSGIIRVTASGTVNDLIPSRCTIDIVVGAECATLESAKRKQDSRERKVSAIATVSSSTKSDACKNFGLVFDEKGKVKSVLVHRQYSLETPADKLEATISSLLSIQGILIVDSRFNVDADSQVTALKVAREKAIAQAHKIALEVAKSNNVVLDEFPEVKEPVNDAFSGNVGLTKGGVRGPRGTAATPIRTRVETGPLDPFPVHVADTVNVTYHTHPDKPAF